MLDPKRLQKELNYENGELGHITRRFCAGICTIDNYDFADQSAFVTLAFDIITNEVIRYKSRMNSVKIR